MRTTFYEEIYYRTVLLNWQTVVKISLVLLLVIEMISRNNYFFGAKLKHTLHSNLIYIFFFKINPTNILYTFVYLFKLARCIFMNLNLKKSI